MARIGRLNSPPLGTLSIPCANSWRTLVQDAIALRLLARGQDHHLSKLKGEALMIALNREQHWDVRLFGKVLEEELDRRAKYRLEIKHGLASYDVTFIDLAQLDTWVQDRLREAQRLAQTATTILNEYLPQVVGEDAVPNELVDVARRLAQVWEDSARWTLRCRSVRVDERAERLVELLSNANANMLDELWEFAHTIVPRLDEAIEESAKGGPSHL